MECDRLAWDQYRLARNQTKNEIKTAKRNFTENRESSKSNPRKTWNLINELSTRNPNKFSNISDIKVWEQTITEPATIAEELNLHFSSIAEKLASEIPSSDVEPESYLKPTKTSFSLKAPTVDVVCNLLLKLKDRKAAG